MSVINSAPSHSVIPAKAGIQGHIGRRVGLWVPAFAGMTMGVMGALTPYGAAAATPCDRACLTAIAERYMDALVAQDWRMLPWAKSVRYSENSVPMMIGDAIWGSISGHARDATIIADPASGNVAWLGRVDEHGQPAFYAMRIKVINGRIAEVETVIRRKEGRPPFGDAAGFVHDKRFAEAPRAKERPSRAVIAAAVQNYYKSVERNNGTVFAKFDPACARVENGVLADTGRYAMAQGCAAQLKAGLFADVGGVRFRVPVIDAERGVAVAFGYFDYPQRETSFNSSDGRSFEAETKYPYSLNFAALFKVTGSGAIQRVDQVAPELNYRIPSPWKE